MTNSVNGLQIGCYLLAHVFKPARKMHNAELKYAAPNAALLASDQEAGAAQIFGGPPAN